MHKCDVGFRCSFDPYNEVKHMNKNQDVIDTKSRSEWEYLIMQWVHDEIGREILVKHLLDGKAYERIAEELSISRATVFNKIKKCSPKLFNHCD